MATSQDLYRHICTKPGERVEDPQWTGELTEQEALKRTHRVSGDCTCGVCGKPFWKHPMETRILSYDGYPFLHRLCNGWLGKL